MSFFVVLGTLTRRTDSSATSRGERHRVLASVLAEHTVSDLNEKEEEEEIDGFARQLLAMCKDFLFSSLGWGAGIVTYPAGRE